MINYINDWLVLAIISLCSGIVGGFVYDLIAHRKEKYDIAELNARVMRLIDQTNASLGVSRRNEKSERKTAALVEAAAIFNDPNLQGDAKQKAMIGLATKYPDIALDLIKGV